VNPITCTMTDQIFLLVIFSHISIISLDVNLTFYIAIHGGYSPH
jgi:hypothetical protein